MKQWWARRDALEKQLLFVLGACVTIFFIVIVIFSAATGEWDAIIAYISVIVVASSLFAGITTLFKLAEKIFPND